MKPLTNHQTRDADANWAVNLGFGFAMYVSRSASPSVTSVDYGRIAALVGEPALQLGLAMSIPIQSSYSTCSALMLGHELGAQLQNQHARLAAVFDFVWRISLLLLSGNSKGAESCANQQLLLAPLLIQAALHAAMLDDASQELIRKLSRAEIGPQHRSHEQDQFMRWAHTKCSGHFLAAAAAHASQPVRPG
jgi:hypothetical protein